jgi:hypothetical protein
MALIARAETITVDDLELTLRGSKLSWHPPETTAHAVMVKIDHSLGILTERVERLLACREALVAMKGKKA